MAAVVQVGHVTLQPDHCARVHESAHALTLFRVLPNGEGRAYTATTFPKDPWQGCEHTIRTARFLGYLADEGDGYGVLDVLDANADIVQDFTVRTAEGFQWIKRRLNLAVEDPDASDQEKS